MATFLKEIFEFPKLLHFQNYQILSKFSNSQNDQNRKKKKNHISNDRLDMMLGIKKKAFVSNCTDYEWNFAVDFVGGGDFGLSGHTPLHPMYVSYSALPPPVYPTINSHSSYPRGTSSSHQSIYRVPGVVNTGEKSFESSRHRIRQQSQQNETTRSNKSNISSRCIVERVEYKNDYSNPLDHLHRPISPGDEYDTLETAARLNIYQKNYMHSPVVSPKLRRSRQSPVKHNQLNRNSSYKPRIFTDHVREQTMRTFYSDPRLAMEQQANVNSDRPLSLYNS